MSSAPGIKDLLAATASGRTLTEGEAVAAFDLIMSGEATPAQIGAFLMGLRVRGETIDEITGAARTMRAKASTIQAPIGAVDTCGTGGDGIGTHNISTAAAFVVAGAGVPVAKHGNKALSSRSGSADVLAALGVNLDAPINLVEAALNEANICFLLAPRHHAAMRHVAGPRSEIGTRTIFNLLGPLANPAGARRQVMGVFAAHWVEPLAQVLGKLGADHAWVVHGSDGLDEITTTGPSQVAEIKAGTVRTFTVSPEEVGLPRAELADLKGGDAAYNAKALRATLDGAPGPLRDIVVLNAAAALVVGGKATDLAAGVAAAQASIDDGRALARLDQLVKISHRTGT